MRATTITLALAASVPTASEARTQWNPHGEVSLRFKYETRFRHGKDPLYTGNLGYSYYFDRHFSVGMNIGAGATQKDVFLATTDINAAYHLEAGAFHPYIGLRGGLLAAIGDEAAGGSAFLGPTVGVKFPLTRHCALDIGMEYSRYGLHNGGSDIFGIRAGVCFGFGRNAKGKTMDASPDDEAGGTGNALSATGKFSGGIEAEGFTSCTTNRGNKICMMYGIRGYALWNAFTPNLYVGVSASVGKNHYRQQVPGIPVSDRSPVRFAIMPRLRYKITEATFAKRIYPFAQIDAGYAYNGVNSQFAVEPAAGLSVRAAGKHAIDLSVGFLPRVYFHSGEKSEGGCLRIALGYTF